MEPQVTAMEQQGTPEVDPPAKRNGPIPGLNRGPPTRRIIPLVQLGKLQSYLFIYCSYSLEPAEVEEQAKK